MEGAIFAFVLGMIAMSPQQVELGEPQVAGAPSGPAASAKPSRADRNNGSVKRVSEATANLVSLFSTDDYPREAIRNGEEGTVAVTLTVDAEGKVADCVVDVSSGSPSLDVATCRILWTRAKFTPARDAKGQPVQDTFHQRIRWELPEGNPASMEEEFSRMIVAVNAERAIVGCRIEKGPSPQAQSPPCPADIEIMEDYISSAPDWIPFAGREIVFETQQRVGDPDGGAELGERPGEFQLLVARLNMTIDAAGKVKSCSRESWGPMRSKDANFTCDFAQRWQFEALPKKETNRTDRLLTIVNAAYLRTPDPKLPDDPSAESTIKEAPPVE